jgi:hypothetical protein
MGTTQDELMLIDGELVGSSSGERRTFPTVCSTS